MHQKKAITQHGFPEKITINGSAANKSGADVINLILVLMLSTVHLFYEIEIRQIRYLNNIVEQDHRSIKRITTPMMGFKAFHSAQATLSGINLHHMLKKGQHIAAANNTVFEQFYALTA